MIATLTMCHAYYDEAYVSHFLKYYQDQGVDHCYLIFNANEDIDEQYFEKSIALIMLACFLLMASGMLNFPNSININY